MFVRPTRRATSLLLSDRGQRLCALLDSVSLLRCREGLGSIESISTMVRHCGFDTASSFRAQHPCWNHCLHLATSLCNHFGFDRFDNVPLWRSKPNLPSRSGENSGFRPEPILIFGGRVPPARKEQEPVRGRSNNISENRSNLSKPVAATELRKQRNRCKPVTVLT